ncbi:hypothetical protein VZT92_009041 [Zoarces viviparus]|uniref:Uncharacterized protein n=1 Tax=Zoarces viviparus TaxID=48416 RepID=A0AAW1FHE4_ZOAVI
MGKLPYCATVPAGGGQAVPMVTANASSAPGRAPAALAGPVGIEVDGERGMPAHQHAEECPQCSQRLQGCCCVNIREG